MRPKMRLVRGVAFSPPKLQGWVFKSTVKQVFFTIHPPNLRGEFHPPHLGGMGCQGRSTMRPPEALLPRSPTWGSPHFSGLTKRGHRQKGVQKKGLNLYGMEAMSLRQPPLSANPLSKPVIKLMTLSIF